MVGYSESTQTTVTDKSMKIKIEQPLLPPPLNILPPLYKDTVIIIKDTVKTITRSPIYKKDTVKVSYKGLNMASYITIPILFSFHSTISQKLIASIGSGIKIHLLQKASGYTINDANYTLSPLSENMKDYYLSSINTAGLLYFLSKHQLLMFQTSFGFSISSMMKQSFPLKRREQSIACTICWGWKF
jgi:hypothetical protein